MKIKKRHIFTFACAFALLATVKMCETDKFYIVNTSYEDMDELQIQGDSLLTKVLDDINDREYNYNLELDSLEKIINEGDLSSNETNRLNAEIIRVERLLDDRGEVDTVFVIDYQEMAAINIEKIDSIVYNIIEVDSVIYNYIYIDSIVNNIVYKIDTIHYNSNDIKKLKLYKN